MKTIRYELLKVKRLRGLHLVYIFPILTSGIALFEMFKRIYASPLHEVIPPFSSFYFQFYMMFSPVIIALILFSIVQVENKNHMWESSLLLPISKGEIYIGKVFISVIFIFAYCLFSYLTYVGNILVCMALYPNDMLLNQHDNMLFVVFFFRMFLAFILYALLIIPVFIYIESAITALGIFMFFIFLSLFLTQKSWFMYYPFSYHLTVFSSFNSDFEVLKDKATWVTTIYAFFAFVIGTFLFKNVRPANKGA